MDKFRSPLILQTMAHDILETGMVPTKLHNGTESDSDADVVVQEGPPDVAVPRKYKVIMHNDDYTTMDFVVDVLKRFFAKNQEEAMQIMLAVHEQGRGVCGVYTYEIAETKIAQVHEYARYSGYPLKCSMEPI